MNNLFQITPWFILIYALLVLVGGVMGYLKAKSKVSLLSGVSSGTALLAAWVLCSRIPVMGLGLATLIALFLSVVFITRLFRTRTFMPAGLMTVLSMVATGLFSVSLLAAEGLL
ncbi:MULTISPECIES: TMEM14 family protein [unclassified Coleofasciculus]|uniref:TMEM14 family protein n=1 Tax=unclassified Coleofasciculus TaxID=2692782 RepID=UPI001881A60C|nr:MULTISPECIES: TMEM14 family protein [unclassified Coleofasciculus]MBE9126865.1 TMEM14 family protein [Coleofasciculus sp. LEGE 07081]MBE9150230.1 TMEM14 family protein [Coleofasciculus sp. LEGE 07092]